MQERCQIRLLRGKGRLRNFQHKDSMPRVRLGFRRTVRRNWLLPRPMQRKYPVPCRDSARHAAGKHGEVNVIEFESFRVKHLTNFEK